MSNDAQLLAEVTEQLSGNTDARFIAEVAAELAAARKHYPPIASVHEGFAIIKEELDEFWQEAKRKPSVRRPQFLRRELVQVAAMACRTAVDTEASGRDHVVSLRAETSA